MLIANVKPMYYKEVFIQMDVDYASSAIRQSYTTMETMLKATKIKGLYMKLGIVGYEPVLYLNIAP